MNANVDLKQLSVRREAAPAATTLGPPRRWFSRVVLPSLVFAGFAAVFAWAARDRWLPATAVTVVPVVSARAEFRAEGTTLFQTAGWVEPRPTASAAAALTEGVVEAVHVIEGQRVKAGEPVAQLVRADAKLALDAAEAERATRLAEIEVVRATAEAAKALFDQPLPLRAALAEVEATAAQKETELATLPFQLAAAKARADLSKINYDGKRQASQTGSVPELVVAQARSEWEAAAALVGELQAKESTLRRELTAQRARVDALRQRLDLKVDERRARAEAEANVKAAEARLAQAEVAVATAQLRYARTIVTAPVDGQVMAIVARPGMRVMGGGTEGSAIVTMYDPARLQVRADVRLEDVPRVSPGQKVRIETPAAGGGLEGEVLTITSQADIQKNTIQAKVAIRNPPATVRPDMLVQVTFLAPQQASPPTSAEATSLRLYVPRRLVETVEGHAHVWTADLAQRLARRKTIKLGRVAGDLVEVLEGLDPSDKIVAEGRGGLVERSRIRIVEGQE